MYVKERRDDEFTVLNIVDEDVVRLFSYAPIGKRWQLAMVCRQVYCI